MAIRREPKPFAIGTVGTEGVGSVMGRVAGPKGTLVSARLNPAEVEDALLDEDPQNDLTATVSDAANALEMADASVYGYAGGARHRSRGGAGETRAAFQALFNDTKNVFVSTKGWMDEKVGVAVKNIPILLKTVTLGTALKVTLNNPTMFANIVHYAKQLGKSLIMSPEGAATWKDYLEAGKAIGGSFGDFIATAATEPTTPAGTILLALFIMKYRASTAGKSLTQLIKDDAATLKTLAAGAVDNVSTVALAQYSAFLKAYEDGYKEGSKEVVKGNLMALAEKAKESVPKGEGAKEISVKAQTGAPSVEMGPTGTVIAVPAKKQKQYKDALEALTKIPKEVSAKEKAAAAAVASMVLAAGVALPMAAGPLLGRGRRRSKTQKRGTKRRFTRRRYLTSPVFAY